MKHSYKTLEKMYIKAQEKISELEKEKAKVERENAQYKVERENAQRKNEVEKTTVWNRGHQEFSADEIYSKLRRNGYRW